MKIGIIDIGSNSIKSLLADVHLKEENLGDFSSNIKFDVLDQKCDYVRISEGLYDNNEKNSLSKSSIERASISIFSLVKDLEQLGSEKIKIFATSAVRDASNKEDFIKKVFEKTDLTIQVLSGEEEASFIGKGLLLDEKIEGINELSAIDLGGGSIENIYIKNSNIKQAVSFNLGAVRLTEKFIKEPKKILNKQDILNAQNFIEDTLNSANIEKCSTLVCLGGVSNVAKKVIKKEILEIKDFENLFEKVCSLNFEDRLLIENLPKDRADILPMGLLALILFSKKIEAKKILISFSNLRFGALMEAFNENR